MKASLQWLRTLAPDLPDDARELARRFTAAGLEIEAMHAYGEGARACLVASVVSMRPHPSRSGLRLVTIDRGDGAPQEVVCGAPNVPDPGGLVVLAPLGAHLPAKGMTIERRAIAGVTSEGMLCSESELGLTEESDGILVLPKDTARPGMPLPTAVPAVSDTIFEIGLTPNRPDCLGHIGLAREAAALFDVPFAPQKPAAPARMAPGPSVDALVSVAIEDRERCAHFGAQALVGATIAPSPLWLRYRLASLGVRPISNVVDITNLVMLEYGHPMHAFDLDRLRGAKIVVRRAKDGEKLKTLDGVDRALTADDLVVCDGEGPVGLAGVMGGGDSEISGTTTRVLLECAYFDPRGVRRAARRHGLHTDASHRFERGVDHGDTADAIARAASLVASLAGASGVPGRIMAVAREIPAATVTLRHARLEQLLGISVPRGEANAVLGRLGAKLRASDASADTFDVPTHRPDIAREVDLIEEVARVRGFDKIPSILPAIHPTRDVGTREELARRARGAATAMGLSEALTYAFVSPAALAAVFAPAATVVLKNPINENHTVMRTSLLPGLLDALGRARRHGERDVAMFTVGPVFLPNNEERMMFAAVLAGERAAYLTKPRGVDVWDAKGIAEGIVTRMLRRSATVTRFSDASMPKHLHPRGAARVAIDGSDVGRLGPLHPDIVEGLDLGEGAVVVEIDLAAVDALGVATPKYTPIPRFPASTRDIALVVHDDVAAGDVEHAVREAAGQLARDVHLFDKFVGGAVPPEHASLAFRVVYRAEDRTLTDAEVDAQHAKVVAEVGKRFGATLRA